MKQKTKPPISQPKQSPPKVGSQRSLSLAAEISRATEGENFYEFSFSSDLPVERWYGEEVLTHAPGSMNLERMNNGAVPLLFNHDDDAHLGVVVKGWLDGSKGRCVAKFGSSPLAQEKRSDVDSGILKNVSFRYTIDDVQPTERGYEVTKFTPLEVSLVTVPADPTVGVGRNIEPEAELETEAEADAEVQPPEIDPGSIEMKTIQPITEVRSTMATEIEQARAEERARIAGITALCSKHGMTDLAEALIEGGRSMDEARAAVLEKLGMAKPQPITGAEAHIGLTQKEARSYSLVRALRAMADPGNMALREAASFEYECSAAAIAKASKQPERGIIVPYDVLSAPIAQRAQSKGTATAGGNLIATDLLAGDFISLLRNKSVLAAMGVRTLTGLQGDVLIPRQTGSTTAYWVNEASAPTTSDTAYDQVSLVPRTVGTFTDMSRKLLLQTSPDIEMLVRSDLATVLAIELDRVGIHGSGSAPEPRGITNVVGIGSVTTAGADGSAPTYSHMVNLEKEVAVDNALLGSMYYLTNTKVAAALKQTQRFTSTDTPVLDKGEINGYPAVITNQVRSNLVKGSSGATLSAAIFGDFSSLLIGMWGGLNVSADPYALATQGGLRVIALQDADVAVRHPESFAACLSLVAS